MGQNRIDTESIARKALHMAKKRKKTSTRTTFTLSRRALTSLKEIQDRENMKMREVLDLVIDMLENDSYVTIMLDTTLIPALQKAVRHGRLEATRNQQMDSGKLVRKTFVLTRENLERLNSIAKTKKVPRDDLLDWTIFFANQHLASVQETKQETLSGIEEDLNGCSATIQDLLDTANEFLGDADPVTHRLGIIDVELTGLSYAIRDYLENGIEIDG